MKKPFLSVLLVLGPLLMLAYFHLGKLLLRNSEAAQWLEQGGGSIQTSKLDAYQGKLTAFSLLGLVAAVIVAGEVTSLLEGSRRDRRPPADRAHTKTGAASAPTPKA